ncbi:MAG: hypothetical protein AAF355_04025 [Myxococcota bacterium]
MDSQSAVGVAPHVLALSSYEASLGSVIELYGTDFPERTLGTSGARFLGVYETTFGQLYEVDLEVNMIRVDGGTLRWSSFGPYQIPFSPNGELGVFRGTIGAYARDAQGRFIHDQNPLAVEFRVLPSILVNELQPTDADCGQPVSRAIGGLPYRISVQAMGFDPVTYTYTLSAPGLDGVQPVQIRRVAAGPYDTLGTDRTFGFPAVPDGMKSYGAVLNISAEGRTGESYSSTFALNVHNAVEIYYDGTTLVQQRFAPIPVSGCIEGGLNGRFVTYTESETETRQRTWSVHVGESWSTTNSESQSVSTYSQVTDHNSITVTYTEGDSLTTEVGGDINQEITLAGAIKAGFTANYSRSEEESRSTSDASTEGSSQTEGEATTDTSGTADSNAQSQGEDFSETISSSDTISRSFGGEIFAESAGAFYRQTTRLLRRGDLVIYNLCGVSTSTGEVDFYDWTWAPDLAPGPSCQTFPQSLLPAADCFLEPCMTGP